MTHAVIKKYIEYVDSLLSKDLTMIGIATEKDNTFSIPRGRSYNLTIGCRTTIPDLDEKMADRRRPASGAACMKLNGAAGKFLLQARSLRFQPMSMVHAQRLVTCIEGIPARTQY